MTYLKHAATTKGLEHLAAIRQLRWYIKITKDKEMLNIIRGITDMKLLRTLVEAGLREPLLTVTVRKADELIERRRRK